MGQHKKWRSEAKKKRRKRIRQIRAQERDAALQAEQQRRQKSPSYLTWLAEQRALELFEEEEEERQTAERHAQWLEEEAKAQSIWEERQKNLAEARAEKVKQDLLIREEWEAEQKRRKAALEDQKQQAEEKRRKQEELMHQIEYFINQGREMPEEFNVASVTNPDKPTCPFFTKTAACRFGDRCSRNHTRPSISRVLLIRNFYHHIGLRSGTQEELELADDWLEYEDKETYQHFLEFYDDVLQELEKIGRVSQFKVCCNIEPHLRGNVYIEYDSAGDAVQAYKTFNGRFYGGRQISVEFVNINSWKAAICGQFHRQTCPKGRTCNFLHVFRNPDNAFFSADQDRQSWRVRRSNVTARSNSRSRSRSWSGSPERNHQRDARWCWSASPPSTREAQRSADSERRRSRRFEDGRRESKEHHKDSRHREGEANHRSSHRREREVSKKRRTQSDAVSERSEKSPSLNKEKNATLKSDKISSRQTECSEKSKKNQLHSDASPKDPKNRLAEKNGRVPKKKKHKNVKKSSHRKSRKRRKRSSHSPSSSSSSEFSSD